MTGGREPRRSLPGRCGAAPSGFAPAAVVGSCRTAGVGCIAEMLERDSHVMPELHASRG